MKVIRHKNHNTDHAKNMQNKTSELSEVLEITKMWSLIRKQFGNKIQFYARLVS